MPIEQVFPNPTVKQVIFQITYPNLFFIENKIGDIQLKIMEKFSSSKLIFRRQLLFVDTGSEERIAQIPPEINLEKESGKKIWQFKSENEVQLNILTDSLDINSEHHKTYNLGEGDKFRDIIQYVVNSFLEITKIPKFNRIGLRYIDDCPIPSKTTSSFREWYNSVFQLDRFPIEDAINMDFRTVIQQDDIKLQYIESLQQRDDKFILRLDFDAFTENVKSSDYLSTTDRLHSIILQEYQKTIKEPVYDFMKTKKV